MHQCAVKEKARARRTLGRRDAAPFNQPRHGVLVQGPKWVRRCLNVMTGVQYAALMAFRYDIKRPIKFVHSVQKDGQIHGPGLGHVVVALPDAVVLVPLPDIAVKGSLAVQLELMNIDIAAQQLPGRFQDPGVADKAAIDIVVGMGGKGGAHHVAALLPHDLGAAFGKYRRDFAFQDRQFLHVEQVRDKDETFILELPDLLGAQKHV